MQYKYEYYYSDIKAVEFRGHNVSIMMIKILIMVIIIIIIIK